MGDDGAAGLKKMKPQKTYFFAQDKETSIVWGMPGAAVSSVPDCKLFPIHEAAGIFNTIFNRI